MRRFLDADLNGGKPLYVLRLRRTRTFLRVDTNAGERCVFQQNSYKHVLRDVFKDLVGPDWSVLPDLSEKSVPYDIADIWSGLKLGLVNIHDRKERMRIYTAAFSAWVERWELIQLVEWQR